MSTELFSLKGRTALVTGSSRGLGRAIAEGLSAAGARVVLNGVSEKNLDAAVSDMTRAGHAVERALFDVGNGAAIVAALKELEATGVSIDILVNNAGIQHRRMMLDVTDEDWNRVINVNLTGPFIVAREVAKQMVPRGHGKIINIGSIIGELARPSIGPYAAAKGGLKMLTKAMAGEWGPHGLQVNAIGPGYMLTDMNEAIIKDEQFDAWIKRRAPAGRWGRPEELVGAAIFLASSASDYVNGQVICVDGGLTAVV